MTPETSHTGEATATPAGAAARRLEALLAAAAVIAERRTLAEVLTQIVESSRALVGARYAALGVLSDDGQSLKQFETSGIDAAARERIGALPRGHGILGQLIRDPRPLRLRRLGDHARSHGFPPNHPPMESFLGVPIAVGGRVFGNLYLTEKIGADEFTEADEHIVILLASQAAAAIANARHRDEQAALVAELQTMQRQRDQFFAMINHELRNALTGVYGWAEQAQRAKTEAGARRAVEEVYESAERTIVLVNNLLDLSRLDAGKIQPVFKPVALEAVVRRAWAGVEPAARDKGVRFDDDYQGIPEPLYTDPHLLGQVLLNLLSNAVRHSPKDERITVRSELVADSVMISVSDRGHGIAHEDQPKIFEPFIRVDPESGLGSGLGLPVSRRMTELLGGRLSVHSELGKGATFTISLPVSDPS